MFGQVLRQRSVVASGIAGLVFALCLTCFGLNQQGSKNTKLTIQVTASRSLIKLPPPGRPGLALPSCELTEKEVRLYANPTSQHKAEMTFNWQVPVGRLIGKTREVTWDLSGVDAGAYTATVEATDKHKHTASDSITVTVENCPGLLLDTAPCPVVSVSCPGSLEPKDSIPFEATVYGGYSEKPPTYEWSLSAGKIVSGQSTPKVIVDVSGASKDYVTVTVTVGGFHPACALVASCSIPLGKPKLQ